MFPKIKETYDTRLPGFFGTFGTGGDSQIFFLQTGLRPELLDRLSLVSDIPGSECWPVRDLFQREVDTVRVTRSLIPYFQDKNKLKFFNPLTLTILPFDPDTNSVRAEMPQIQNSTIEEDGMEWAALELPGYFRFRHPLENPQWGLAEWADSHVKIVAIDGQHRLSALKRVKNDPRTPELISDFFTWTVPVVLLSVRPLSAAAQHRRVLDVVRNIFVYINTEAKAPSESRQILLSDESINCICTQQILQYAHDNDVRDEERRELTRVPLLFFDWRGVEHGGQEVASPAALKSIQEIRDWLEYYLLGEDFTTGQETALGVQPTDKLKHAFLIEKLTPQLSLEARTVFDQRVLPAIAIVLEKFKPYQQYIRKLRELEKAQTSESDIAGHAFHKIRFGDNRATHELSGEIRAAELAIVGEITALKLEFPFLLNKDIGMRAIMSAFGLLKKKLTEFADPDAGWHGCAEWFVKSLNDAWDGKWMQDDGGAQYRLLKHLAYDHQDIIVNYRLDDVPDALGALMAAVILSYGAHKGNPGEDVYVPVRDELLDTIQDRLEKGYRKEVRVELREQFPQGGKALTKAVAEEARKRAESHTDRIRRALKKIATPG